jgi:GNAT superfamily N-acetyltransferase
MADLSCLAPLVAAAEREGFRMVRRSVDEWRDGTNRFYRPGEVFFGAFAPEAGCVGAGGLNVDPYEPVGPEAAARAGRLRHLYVLPTWRRRGIGRLLVARIVAAARGTFACVQLRAPASGEANPFYLALGFEVVIGHPTCTHRLRVS